MSRYTLKDLLKETLLEWDHDGTLRNVRETFWKIIKCGTEVLGAQIYASNTDQRIVYHTCKSLFCPSCGARSAAIWQEEIETALPQIPYIEINFTMPQVFWPLLQRNRRILGDLPALGAAAIEFWAKASYGARVILMVVQQTYGGFLNFYPHLHTLVSAGGLDASTGRWIHSLSFQNAEHKHELMLAWKLALLTALDTASKDDVLESDRSSEEVNNIIETEGRRKWNVYVGRLVPKSNVIDHIGRYIRKPPIAQYRLNQIDDHYVQYLAKDTRNRCLTPVIYSRKEFVKLLMPHVNDRYCNSMRYFGLLAPRSKMLLTQVFSVLKQQQRPRPVRLSYAESIYRTFGQNPLIGRDGQPLLRVGHIKPLAPA
ncbi:MAG TPA: transposase [Candidatus Sulfotelmatobacter sp.]